MKKHITYEEKFNEEFIPIFRKISFERNKPFYIPEMKSASEYESYLNMIYHGLIYNFFMKVYNLETLNYSEYSVHYKNDLSFKTFKNETTVYYGIEPIVIISKYKHKTKTSNYSKNLDSIKAVYNMNNIKLNKDVKDIKRIENKESLTDEEFATIIKDTRLFMIDGEELNFDDFEDINRD